MTETNNECAKYTMELRVLSFLLQNYDIPPRRSAPPHLKTSSLPESCERPIERLSSSQYGCPICATGQVQSDTGVGGAPER